MRSLLAPSILLALLTLSACSAVKSSSSSSTTTGTGGAGGSGGDITAGTTSGEGGSFTSAAGGAGGGQGGGEPQIAEVYGHSPTTLYRLDPDTKAVTEVGAFDGCGQVIDIALDKDSHLYGTTFDGLYTIDKTTAKCALIASGGYPNSLSFVPAGTVDPDKEALVGYLGSTYVRIDPQTGTVTTIGGISGGYSSSGDVVSVKGGKTYLTVNGFDCSDCIVEVDPKTGDLVKNWGTVGHSGVYGLAFWAGKAYGFDDFGQIFEIDFAMDGSGVSTVNIPIPGNPTLQFWGAGSTTSAPPVPVPK
ncbi:MAG: hypothetical protein U0359_14260 [Byssovorax sp.]